MRLRRIIERRREDDASDDTACADLAAALLAVLDVCADRVTVAAGDVRAVVRAALS